MVHRSQKRNLITNKRITKTMKRTTITLLFVLYAVMLSTVAAASPFDIMKKAKQRQIYYVKDIPGGSGGNILPAIYRKSFRLQSFQCSGLPNGYDVIRWNVDIDSIDESKGYSQFTGRSLQIIAESRDNPDAIVFQTYDVTGSYKDGTLEISTANPAHFLSEKTETNFQNFKGSPGIINVKTPSSGKTWRADFLVDEFGTGLFCEVSSYVEREPYTNDQWKQWIEKGTNYEKQRGAAAKIPTTLFGKIEIAKKNSRKDVEKVIIKSGGKIISDVPGTGNVVVKYDISSIITEASAGLAVYVPENGEQILSMFIIKINPPTQVGQKLPAHRVHKMLTEKYGNPKDGYWKRDDGKTTIVICIDNSAWTGYSGSMVSYSNVKYSAIADARTLESKKTQQKNNKNAF